MRADDSFTTCQNCGKNFIPQFRVIGNDKFPIPWCNDLCRQQLNAKAKKIFTEIQNAKESDSSNERKIQVELGESKE